MGRVKLQIKRIENTTNRQVTFSKRRNGLVKKAYELSILCDVDVALIMFSPSGRVSLFSGNNKSIEEVMMRYVNLPEHERGRLHNQEFLQRVLRKFRADQDSPSHHATCTSNAATDSQIQVLQRDIGNFRSQIEDLENQLRIYQGNFSQTTTLREAESQELALQDSLKRLRKRKLVLKEEHSHSSRSTPATPQILEYIPPKPADVNILEWLSQGDQQVQIENFADANQLLRLRNHAQHLTEILPSPLSPLHGQHPNFDEQTSINEDIANQNNLQHSKFGQFDNVNLTPWPKLYQPGTNTSSSCNNPLLELYLSRFHAQQF